MLRYVLFAAVRSAVLVLACVAPARSHIVLAEPEALTGSSYLASFRVSHACGSSPTVKLRVEIPESVTSVRPQPKAGWTLKVERLPLARPLRTESGGEVRDRVSAIVWEGVLEAEFFDQFSALLKLPTEVGLLYFPATQSCASGENRWVEIPAAGKAWTSVPRPAPVLKVVSPAPAAGAEHAHH